MNSVRLLLGERSGPRGLSVQDHVNTVKPLQVTDYSSVSVRS